MDDEKLIECVSKYEFLYNLKHPKYMDAVKKENAWREISEKLKQPATACKQKWQCLRDCYRRALNKKKGKTGLAAKNMKPWKYESEMSFILPFFTERKHQDFIQTSGDEESDNVDENTMGPITEEPSIELEVDETVAYDFNVNHSARKAIKRKADGDPLVFTSRLLDDQNQIEPRGQDELDRFFLSISDTVKRFPPFLQALAKNKIFTVVSEMELQQLAPQNSSVYGYSLSPKSEPPL